MSSRRQALAAAVCLLGSMAHANAQHCHSALRGHIYESSPREPLPYATVFVRETGQSGMSDETGYFEIIDLCEDSSYTVEVSHIECDHLVRIVRVRENTAIDFTLEHDAVLKEVVITEKALAPAPAQAQATVSQTDLDATRGANLAETLRKLPGVSVLSTGTTIGKPVIQGLHSNRIAIVNNNVVLEGQQWGREHAPEIDPFSAGKIMVIKGAAGVRYGPGAMGGAVILEPEPLRKQPGFGGWISAAGNSSGRGGILAAAADWRHPVSSLAARIQATIKRSGNLRAPDYFLHNTGLAEYDITASAGWRKNRWEFESGISSFNLQTGILRSAHVGNLTDLQLAIASDIPLNNQNRFTYAIDRPFQQASHLTLRNRAVLRINDTWKLSGQYVLQYNQRREYDVVRSSGSASTRPQLSFQLWTNTLDAALEHPPIRHWQGGIGVQAIQQTNFVGRGGLIPDYNALGGSVWIMERRRRYPQPWEFELGARYDYRHTAAASSGSLNNIDTLVHFGNASGTAGVIYHFNRHCSVTFNSGLAWRPPHVNELFARGVHHGAGTFEQGNPALISEKAWNNNLSFQWNSDQWTAQISVYSNRIRDFIYLDPQNTFVLTVRGAFPAYFYRQADAILNGLDGSASIPLGKSLHFEPGFSLIRGRRVTDAPEGDWLPLMPADRFQYGIRWTKTGSDRRETYLRLGGATVLRQSRIPAAGLLKPAPAAYTLLNLDGALQLSTGKKPVEIGLSVTNLLNTRYRDYMNFFRFYADEPGINISLRLKLII